MTVETGKGLLRVSVDVHQVGEFSQLRCSISNIGTADIALNRTYLFVDQGIYNESNSSFEFPFLQKKFLGIDGVADEDCIGCALCKSNNPAYPLSYSHISNFYKSSKPFCNCYPLPHLSCDSILYMAPDEIFTEDIVLKLKKGVYRAILMSVPKPESCDCICCNRCFCVM